LIVVYDSSFATIINIPDDYQTIQQGIDASTDGDTVLVQPETYVENINFNGHNIVLGSLFLTTGDAAYIAETIIDGNSMGTVVTFESREDSTLIMTGFTIQNGYAENGGGIHCGSSSPRLAGLIIANNVVENGGAGIDIFGSSPTLVNCIIISNDAGNFGGGMSNDMSSPILINCVFYDNSAVGAGGGISNYTNSQAIMINCLISGNSAGYGGGMWNGWSSPTATNCIFWGNTPDEIDGGSSIVTFSDIQGGWEGEGNIDVDPFFRDPENGDFHLMSTECGDPFDSPCIDTGLPDIIDSLLDCSWGLGTILSDMGAYGGGDSTTVGITDDKEREIPNRFALAQNYPNPFNISTVIHYQITTTSNVTIEIYDILGRKVETLIEEEQPSGYHRAIWNAESKSSGIYFYRIQAGDFVESRKMMLLK
jgi:hypothetical protein